MSQATNTTGKVAVVTGRAGSIGGARRRSLQDAGVTAFSLDLVRPPGSNAPFVNCDVRDDASVARAIADVASQHGGIDIAIHAAGISRDAVVWKLSVEDWDIVQSVNLRGAFLLIRHVLPVM